MILENIRLTNFRCFKELFIPLDPHLNVFVGENGAGKTAILDSVALALAPILARLPFEKAVRSKPLLPYDLRQEKKDQAASHMQIAAVATSDGTMRIAWDRIRFRDQSPNNPDKIERASVKGNSLTELDKYIFGIIDAHNESRPYTLPVFAFYNTNRAVDLPHNRLQKKSVPSHFKRLAGLENALESKTDFKRAVRWFDLFEQRELREQRDNATSSPLPELDAVRRAIQCMIPGVGNPRIDAETGRFAVNLQDSVGTSIKLYLDQLSDGFQVMLGVVMDFALRLALANPASKSGVDVLNSEAILIIDEVDLHLHPVWQQSVIPDLRRTFPNTQLILSTHSPQVLSTVDKESIRVIRVKDGGVVIEIPTFQTRGVESTDVLSHIMGIDPVPKVEESVLLNKYVACIEEGNSERSDAQEMRKALIAHFGRDHPLILDCDRLIRFQSFKRRKAHAEQA